MNFQRFFIISLSFLAMLLTACYEEQEGCLDIEASNFDVDADNPCSDCCNYPQLSLNISHKLQESDSSEIFRTLSVYQLPHNTTDLLKVKKVFFYLSDLQLLKPGGEVVDVLDTITIGYSLNPGDTLYKTVTDNFAYLLRSSLSVKNIGEIKTEGVFEGLQFRIGLPEESRDYVPSTLPGGHPLNYQSDSLNWSEQEGYAYQYWEFFRDTADIDSTVIRITAPYSEFIQLYGGFEIRKGYDIKVTLRVDYLEWWRGVDPKNMTLEEIRDILVANVANAFSIDTIEN